MATYTATTLAELYTMVGYWDDSGAARVAGTAGDGDIVNVTATGTQVRGDTDNILMPAPGVIVIGPGSGSLTIEDGRLAVSGSGGTSGRFYLEGITFDFDGQAALPAALTPHAGDLMATALRSSGMMKDVALTDSAGRSSATNFSLQVLHTDDPVVLILDSVESNKSGGDCISPKASQSIVGENAEGSKIITINCTASDPGTASNNQAFTSHDGIAVYGWGNSYTWNSGKAGFALSTVNDTYHYESNITAVGDVSGIVDIQGLNYDSDGGIGGLGTTSDYSGDGVWEDVYLTNWAADSVARDALRLNNTDAARTRTFRRLLFDNTNGTCVRVNSSARGTAIFEDCATAQGSTGLDRVISDSGATMTIDMTGSAMQCSAYSLKDAGSITYRTVTGNIFESDGDGYSVAEPANTLGTAPTNGEVIATGAGNATYPAPDCTIQVIKGETFANLAGLSANPTEVRRMVNAGSQRLDPATLKPGLVADSSTLKPGLVNSSYTSGAGDSDTLKPGLLDSDGNLKPGLLDADGNLKPSLLK